MHELSLVRALLIEVDRLAADHRGTSVDEIEVEIGPLSGVEPVLVRTAFEQLVCDTSAPDARLVIREIPLSARCLSCESDVEIVGFVFQCQSCGSPQMQVTGGDQFRLLSLSVREPEAAS